MKSTFFAALLRRLILTPMLGALLLGVLVGAASASPGSHGPNGEHLDSHQADPSAASSAPRLEAQSELFELVGRLSGGEFSLLIDRFATNEPVLKAEVEVESGQLKAKARFHEDLGDYAVDDPAMLKLLATPGEHPVVVTIVAGQDSDLLNGVLRVDVGQQPDAMHAHAVEGGRLWRWGLLAALLAAAGWAWRLRQRSRGRNTEGGRA
jgi:hypothetical protein